jgi:hypothetical protein
MACARPTPPHPSLERGVGVEVWGSGPFTRHVAINVLHHMPIAQ